MKISKLAFAAFLLISQANCDRDMSFFRRSEASKGPFAYTIRVELTPAVAQRMKDNNYHLNVHAFYYGHAKVAKATGADELNRIELGYEVNAFPAAARTMNMPGDGINKRLFSQIAENGPTVLLTILAVNRSNFENESLVCQNYIGRISEIQARPPIIKCHGQSEAGFAPS
jgi:hypothetical protein